MNRLALVVAVLLPLTFSCLKVWVADLREKALDTIRGYYELESAVWEGSEPLDINGDGSASYDYYSQWLEVDSGWGDFGATLHNDGGYIQLPYTRDTNEDWGDGLVRLQRSVEEINVSINTVVGTDEAVLEFSFPQCEVEFEHTGYGEFLVRKEMTFYVINNDKEAESVTGPVLFSFKRIEYKPN